MKWKKLPIAASEFPLEFMKTIPRPSRRRILAAAIVTLTSLGAAFTIEAATISWGAATTIVDDNDVNTAGTLVSAANVAGSATTVNGVLFSNIERDGSSGPFALSATSSLTTFAPPGVSADYASMLSTGVLGSTITLTISELVSGESYSFQWWSNRSAIGGAGQVTSAGGPLVDANTTDAENGPGQFQIGTFIADNAIQQIAFTAAGTNSSGLVSGFQLRQIPEPTTTAFFGVALFGAVGMGRRRAKSA
jgi:PEP-CTERM motif